MKKKIGITQRVDINSIYGERRDALDQNWSRFILAMDMLPVPIPNGLADPDLFLNELNIDGIVFSGGNDLAAYGGNAPERDCAERKIIDWCISSSVPLIGVCRGMQMIHVRFGGSLKAVDGHVKNDSVIIWEGKNRSVNSYHNYAIAGILDEFKIDALSEDGVIEAFSHRTLKISGIMWHPERSGEINQLDINYFKKVLR